VQFDLVAEAVAPGDDTVEARRVRPLSDPVVPFATTFAKLHQEGVFGQIWQVPTADAVCALAARLAR
jgi:hypothetical protein